MSNSTVTDDKGHVWNVMAYRSVRKYSARCHSRNLSVVAGNYKQLLERILAA